MIPYGRQSIDENDIAAVVDTLKSDYLTQGPKVSEFENAISNYCGARYAVAVNSATSALHIACLALGLKQGGRLWTSPITFVASANCGLYCGAEVDFVDVEPDSGCMSVSALAEKLASADAQNRLPDIVIPVSFAGQSCDMQAISVLSKRYGFRVIEDAAHALGASYQNEKVGSCRYADITTFSFHPVKLMTAAEGGMAVTNNADVAEKMRMLSSHGITRDPALMLSEKREPWGYDQLMLGFNYRISDIHCALGLSQLRKLDEFVATRNAIASQYDDAFLGTGIRPLAQDGDCLNSYHLYVVRLPEDIDRREVFTSLRARNIGVNVHYIPVYKQPYFRQLGFAENYCPGAECYYRSAITLPLFPDLGAKDFQYVIDTVQQILPGCWPSSSKGEQ